MMYEDVDQEILDNEFGDEPAIIEDFPTVTNPKSINYKYNEMSLINDLAKYVDSTYISDDNSHYAKSKIETTEVIIDNGFGMAFCMGNVLKYAQRYGKKDGYNRKDLMKVLHYTLMALYIHDDESEKDCFIEHDKRK